jgi:hypothetical protein
MMVSPLLSEILVAADRGWWLILLLWAAETATAVSLLIIIISFRESNEQLKATRQSIGSLTYTLWRVSSELRIQQEKNVNSESTNTHEGDSNPILDEDRPSAEDLRRSDAERKPPSR